MKVAICDDSAEIRNTLCGYLADFSRASGIEIEAFVFDDGAKLLQADYASFGLLIMDIQMPQLNGLDTARAIRRAHSKLSIIFITNYIQYALEGYEVQAFRFLLKPISYEQFSDVVGKALRQLCQRQEAFLNIRAKDGMSRVPVEDILYIETEKGHVVVHTREKEIACYSPMKEVEAALNGQFFFRCHSAYLVHLQEIKTVTQQDVLLQNGQALPLSKHRKKALKEALTVFLGDNFL